MNGSCELLADVSTVGNRVRIRYRSGSNAVSTNMSQSVKLLDNNPPSALKEDDVCNLKKTYGLSSSVTLRLPLSSERAADARPDEIVVYESYYAAGLREVVPSLIAQISTRLAISPGQLYPFAWRLLIAIQTFGELESIAIGVEEIMYAYYFTKFEADPGRYSMHTRNHPPLAIDLKHHAKKSLEEAWRERYIFMKVGRNPGFPTSWFVAGVKTKAKSIGRAGALEVVKHPLPHRSVEFLTSSFALENSTIWGFTMSNGQQCSTSVAFARFMAASGKLTEANPASSNHVPDDYGDEVQFLGDTSSHKRKTHGDTTTSPEARRSRKICNDRTVAVTTTTSPDAEELKSKILSRNFETLIASGSASIDDGVYHDLLKAMSTFHFAEKRLSSERQIVEDLRRELDNEMSKTAFAHKTIASKDSDISRLEASVREHNQTKLDLQARYENLMKENELRQREITALNKRITVLKHELDFYLNGAAIIARWEALRECLLGEHKGWKLDEMDMQYQTVMRSQAQFKGMPPPVFEESLVAIGAREPVASEQDTSEPIAP